MRAILIQKFINIMCLKVIIGVSLLLSVVSIKAEDGNVAFSAGFFEDQIIDRGDVVVYNDVFTNQGNGYDSSTGVFTAPKDGFYVFSINALTMSKKEFGLELYHDETYLISSYVRIENDYASGGNSIVLRLLENDTVYVKSGGTTSYIFGRPNEAYATFTGYLIGSFNSAVAFTAGLNQDLTIGSNQNVAYKKMYANYGNGYSSSNGVFTAPKAGIYVFFISGLTQQNRHFWIDLYKNEEYMISAFARHNSNCPFGGNSIVLRLVNNDRIYLKARLTAAHLFGRWNEVYATFTGFLLDTLTDPVGNVAFTAGFKENQTVEGNQILAYKEVYTNHAGGYNSSTGVFTAPKGGLYVFNINALTTLNKDFWIDLYQNDKYLISAFARLKGDYASAGNSIALKLKPGDRVYVKTRRTVYLFGQKKIVFATFSGYLISQSTSDL